MKLFKYTIALGLLALTAGFAGCDSNEPQTIQPRSQGQRGESCQARNDCRGDLACVNGLCVKDDFDIAPTAQHCHRVECAATADCCGDRPTEAPARCAERAVKCESQLAGCTTGTTCTAETAASACNGGTCTMPTTYCADTLLTGCTSHEECTNTTDSCDTDGTEGKCITNTEVSCTIDADCHTAVTCVNLELAGSCSCANPDYDPLDPICSDPECFDLCTLTCEDERCVADTSCETNNDCLLQPSNANLCSSGRCVQCESNDDCDAGLDESCIEGSCVSPCEYDEECAFFHSCQDGQCVETGCTSDRECVLALAGSILDEARLAVCLPSETDPSIRACKIPCETDVSCSSTEVCLDGFCQYIGCESDNDCRYDLNLAGQTPTPTRPYVTRGECRAE